MNEKTMKCCNIRGRTGLDAALNNEWDAILLDLMLPVVLNDSFKVSLKIIKNRVDALLMSCYNNEVVWMR
ncbi:hypothetical protein EfmAA94_16440 [Enterococcus faecium]|nr:hypothetical protein EfmAA94_16440 [Enterococcus faecium]